MTDFESRLTQLEVKLDRLQARLGIAPLPIPIWRFVQVIVAATYDITVEEMVTRNRSNRIVWPRFIALALAKELCDPKPGDLAHWFGYDDYTSVMHAQRAVQDRLVTEPSFAADYSRLRERLVKLLEPIDQAIDRNQFSPQTEISRSAGQKS